ncbi:MAG: hypothetical protein QY323_04490 [Patescibacteria group bacterium]|nr:MAG: hypothetical protein QY323_04490 [Patescibacteria group bacterium]
MSKYLLIGLIVIAGIGWVVADEFYFSEPSVTDCCANDFDATPYETTPAQP